MKLKSLRYIKDFLLPQQCAGCHTWDQGPLCSVCFQTLELAGERQMQETPSGLQVFGLLNYTGIVREIIHGAKYQGEIWRLQGLCDAIFECIPVTPNLTQSSVVVAVPGDPWRTWTRGYNPAQIIARSVAKWLNVTERSTLIRRRIGGVAQQTLSLSERTKRYDDDTFVPNGSPTGIATETSVIVVDDIVTTGATLRANVRALELMGIQAIPLGLCIGG